MMRFLLILILSFISLPAFASSEFDLGGFGSLPVQHEGRIKPIDTLARAYLENFSGRESASDLSAEEWFAEALFDPAKSIERPVFQILRPQNFGLEPRKGSRYSFAEISSALARKGEQIMRLAQADPKSWSEDQRELMELHERSILYMQIVRSFSMILPMDMSVPDTLAKEWKIPAQEPITYASIAKFEVPLQKKLQQIIRRKGDDPDKYGAREKEIAAFAFNVESVKLGGASNVLFRVVPSVWEGAKGTWFAPWVVSEAGHGSVEASAFLKSWERAAQAYGMGSAAEFKAEISALHEDYQPYIKQPKLDAEMFYNNAHPIGFAMFGYLLAFFAIAASSIFEKAFAARIAFGLLSLSAVAHSAAIALRVYILDRPPVGTLYESILFVAAICAIIGVIFELRRKDGIGILMGAVTALLLLFTAQGFESEDTMKMLVAVLNTNFWLATHVLCITAGYGLCVITAAIAHIHLYRAAFGKQGETSLMPAMKVMGLFALLFTTVGTILGGIWADQSWGRFWGWDPKENGALLIVLWLIWVYHSHLSGHLKLLSLTAAMAAINIVVALAWFGVNLLNVGLHSYGFISGVAASLGAFCAAELAIIGWLWVRAHNKKALEA